MSLTTMRAVFGRERKERDSPESIQEPFRTCTNNIIHTPFISVQGSTKGFVGYNLLAREMLGMVKMLMSNIQMRRRVSPHSNYLPWPKHRHRRQKRKLFCRDEIIGIVLYLRR